MVDEQIRTGGTYGVYIRRKIIWGEGGKRGVKKVGNNDRGGDKPMWCTGNRNIEKWSPVMLRNRTDILSTQQKGSVTDPQEGAGSKRGTEMTSLRCCPAGCTGLLAAGSDSQCCCLTSCRYPASCHSVHRPHHAAKSRFFVVPVPVRDLSVWESNCGPAVVWSKPAERDTEIAGAAPRCHRHYGLCY